MTEFFIDELNLVHPALPPKKYKLTSPQYEMRYDGMLGGVVVAFEGVMWFIPSENIVDAKMRMTSSTTENANPSRNQKRTR